MNIIAPIGGNLSKLFNTSTWNLSLPRMYLSPAKSPFLAHVTAASVSNVSCPTPAIFRLSNKNSRVGIGHPGVCAFPFSSAFSNAFKLGHLLLQSLLNATKEFSGIFPYFSSNYKISSILIS